jgi:hypothetical protein
VIGLPLWYELCGPPTTNLGMVGGGHTGIGCSGWKCHSVHFLKDVKHVGSKTLVIVQYEWKITLDQEVHL